MLYLAAPYNHPEPEVVERRMSMVYAKILTLMNDGHVVVSPLLNDPLVKIGQLPTAWSYWQRYSETLLSSCERMVVLNLEGWDQSTGIAGEIDFCRKRSIPVEHHEIDQPLSSLISLIKNIRPELVATVRGRPRLSHGSYWADYVFPRGIVTIQWSPTKGFGISLNRIDQVVGYGEGHDHVVWGSSVAAPLVMKLCDEACTVVA